MVLALKRQLKRRTERKVRTSRTKRLMRMMRRKILVQNLKMRMVSSKSQILDLLMSRLEFCHLE
jgi:hypothetical protein